MIRLPTFLKLFSPYFVNIIINIYHILHIALLFLFLIVNAVNFVVWEEINEIEWKMELFLIQTFFKGLKRVCITPTWQYMLILSEINKFTISTTPLKILLLLLLSMSQKVQIAKFFVVSQLKPKIHLFPKTKFVVLECCY